MSSLYIIMIHLLTFLHFVLLVTQASSVERISIPHDVLPGYSIKQLHSKSRILNSVENGLSPYFAVLDDGCLISTKKLSHLADTSVDLLIEEDHDGVAIIKPFVINVRNHKKMMKFPLKVYNGNIDENEPANTIVENLGNLKVTNNMGSVNYTLTGSNDFAVFFKDGFLAIVSTKILDREAKNVYLLQLNATDSEGCIASTLIRIIINDVNDNEPVFTKKYYSWNIKPDFPIYSTVGRVKAIDADGDKPYYKFSSNTTGAFIIVPQTGEIILTNQPEYGVYSYFVMACDNRENPLYSERVPVTISITSEKKPEKILRRSKRSIRQTRVYDHFAESDASMPGKVMFRLESVHPDEIFSLESENRWIDVDHNGDVKVREPWDYEQLEREKTIDFWVEIRAPQQPEPDRQRIIIHVQDSNDENPYFINRPMPMQAVVQLNAPPGTQVFKLQARDPDLDSNIRYYLVRDRTAGRFEVDEMTGEVRTVGNDPFNLDMEYVLYVKAEDLNGMRINGREQSTDEERLSIIGGKRPPQFFMQSYSATIPENKKKDSE